MSSSFQNMDHLNVYIEIISVFSIVILDTHDLQCFLEPGSQSCNKIKNHKSHAFLGDKTWEKKV